MNADIKIKHKADKAIEILRILRSILIFLKTLKISPSLVNPSRNIKPLHAIYVVIYLKYPLIWILLTSTLSGFSVRGLLQSGQTRLYLFIISSGFTSSSPQYNTRLQPLQMIF